MKDNKKYFYGMLVAFALLIIGIGIWLLYRPVPYEIPGCYKQCHINLNNPEFSCAAQAEPPICTMEYRAGDACLQYAHCGTVNGECQSILESEFYDCISCYQWCMNTTADIDSCEKECGSQLPQ